MYDAQIVGFTEPSDSYKALWLFTRQYTEPWLAATSAAAVVSSASSSPNSDSFDRHQQHKATSTRSPYAPDHLHQEKIHLLENGLKVLKMAF